MYITISKKYTEEGNMNINTEVLIKAGLYLLGVKYSSVQPNKNRLCHIGTTRTTGIIIKRELRWTA